MPRKPRTLRSTLIDPFKQLKLGAYLCSLSLLFVVLIAVMVTLAFREQYQNIIQIFQVPASIQDELIHNDIFQKNFIRIGSMILIYAVSLIFMTFWLTHKYYGPLVSIERFVEQIRDGQYQQRVRVRHGDELQDLVKGLNEMAEALEHRHGNPLSEGQAAPPSD